MRFSSFFVKDLPLQFQEEIQIKVKRNLHKELLKVSLLKKTIKIVVLKVKKVFTMLNPKRKRLTQKNGNLVLSK